MMVYAEKRVKIKICTIKTLGKIPKVIKVYGNCKKVQYVYSKDNTLVYSLYEQC